MFLLSSHVQYTSSSHGAASDLIRTIRARHGFDDGPLARHTAVTELRGILEHALDK